MDNQQQQRLNEAAQQFTDALVAAYRATSDRTMVAQELSVQLTEYFFTTVINNLRTQAGDTLQITQQFAKQQERAQEATRELAQASTDTYMELLDSIFTFYQGHTSRAQRRTEEAQRRVEEAEVRAEEAERSTGEAEKRAEDAERRTGEAEKRAEETERGSEETQKRAEQAERSTEEAKGQTAKVEERAEEAERRAEEAQRQVEQAQRRAEEAERSIEEAQRRIEEADRRAEEAERRAEKAERSSSEAESQGGDDLPLTDYDSLNLGQISERLNELSVEEIRHLRDYEVRNKDRRTLVQRLNSRIEASS